MKKQILALGLILVLCVGLLPNSVLAITGNSTDAEEELVLENGTGIGTTTALVTGYLGDRLTATDAFDNAMVYMMPEGMEPDSDWISMGVHSSEGGTLSILYEKDANGEEVAHPTTGSSSPYIWYYIPTIENATVDADGNVVSYGHATGEYYCPRSNEQEAECFYI